MRVGLFAVLALVGLASAAPVKHGKRGGKKCVCTKKSSPAPVVWVDSSSSSSSSSGSSGSSGSSWIDTSSSSGSEGSSWVESSSTNQYGVVQRVVYVSVVTVPVPVVTTCTATGTIVIENNITINVTVVPTVFNSDFTL